MKNTLVFFLMMILCSSAFAQTQNNCVDENVADPYYPCGSFFSPVCACNGVTYVNECAARFQGGVYSGNWQGGPCENFYYFLYPNPVSNVLNIRFQFRESGTAILYLMTLYGEVLQQRPVRNTNNQPINLNLDVSTLTTGLYFLSIQSNNFQKTERVAIIRP